MTQQHFARRFDPSTHDSSAEPRQARRSAVHVLVPLLVLAACAGCGSDATPLSAPKSASPTSAASASATSDDVDAASTVSEPAETDANSAAGGVKPCDLLTKAEMEPLFGAPVESTEIPFESITTTTQCLWNKVSDSVGGADELPAHYVLVQIPTDEYDLDQLHRKIERGGINGLSSAVEGIGDGAVLVVGGEGISVVVGESGFHLRIALDPDPTDDVVKALAVAAAGRMAQGS